MAEAIVGPLLSKLQEVVVKEAKALAKVGGDIDKLRDKLLWLHALVHEADLHSRHDGSRLVQVLAFQIRDAGFDAEDAVDQFYLQGSLSRRFGRNRWWRISKEFVSHFWTHIRVRAILSRRIQSVNVRLEEIIGNNSTYTMSKSGSGDGKTWRASRAIPPMRTDWDTDYSMGFVLEFREKEKGKLMGEINKENEPKVITVAGVEGVGKTALLMHAYKESNKEVVRIWLSFPPDIDHESMFKQIEEELGNKAKAMGKDPKEDRCLVVIGSPVRTMTWRKVESKLLGKVKIVLSETLSWREERTKQDTTSKEKTHATIQLHPMDEDHSVELFNLVYGLKMCDEKTDNKSKYEEDEMNHIRSYIMDITNGLPLTVVLLARLMRTVDFGKWKAAAAYLKCNSEDSKLKTILSVCVDDLTDELKSCLLYTAGFPESRPIDADQLVRLWMAEGFLTQQHKLETEQLGQCYLKELIYRGLLHLKRKAPGGHVQWVTIPDQIHPLLRSEAQRTSFMHVHYGGSLLPPGNTRRLAVVHSYDKKKFPKLDNCLEKLRTVVSYSDDYTDCPYGRKQEKSSKKNEHEPEQSSKDEHKHEPKPLVMREFLQRSPYLRVINLEGIQVVKKKKKKAASTLPLPALPHEIGEMVHLQYLGVRYPELKEVPSSVGNLRNLQTIDVRGTGVRSLPDSLWKVKTLRHVLGDKLAFPRSSTDVVDDDQLKLMQTLQSVTIDHQDHDSRRCTAAAACKRRKLKLLRFRSLHRLHVAELENCHGEDLADLLKGLESSLEALILSGEGIPMDLFAEASASWMMKHMESLMLDGPLHDLPDDASYKKLLATPIVRSPYLANLTHLVLRSTKIGQEFIDWIGKLQGLDELELLEGSYKDKELTIGAPAGEFSSLTMLRISGLYTLEKICVPDATARRERNKAIKMDVPDHVVVPEASDQQDPTTTPTDGGDPDHVVVPDERSSSEPQPSAGTPASDQLAPQNPMMPPTDEGDPGSLLKEDKDKDIFTKIILDAAYSNNSSITTITNYIRDEHVYTCLKKMVESGEVKERKVNGRNKYELNSQSNEEVRCIITKMIKEAIDGKNTSITSITNYIKNTYVTKHLDRMVQDGKLKKEQANSRYYKYVIPNA